jgi:hypothetical protein
MAFYYHYYYVLGYWVWRETQVRIIYGKVRAQNYYQRLNKSQREHFMDKNVEQYLSVGINHCLYLTFIGFEHMPHHDQYLYVNIEMQKIQLFPCVTVFF